MNEALIEEWKTSIYDKANEIDPESVLHWGTLCYGWLLGKGLSVDEALELSFYMRYELEIA